MDFYIYDLNLDCKLSKSNIEYNDTENIISFDIKVLPSKVNWGYSLINNKYMEKHFKKLQYNDNLDKVYGGFIRCEINIDDIIDIEGSKSEFYLNNIKMYIQNKFLRCILKTNKGFGVCSNIFKIDNDTIKIGNDVNEIGMFNTLNSDKSLPVKVTYAEIDSKDIVTVYNKFLSDIDYYNKVGKYIIDDIGNQQNNYDTDYEQYCVRDFEWD